MKLMLILSLLLGSLLAAGQPVRLINTWKAGSDTLYIGVPNILLIEGDTAAIISSRSDKAKLKRSNDSLTIFLKGPGTFDIRVEAAGRAKTFTFNSDYLPLPLLVLTGEDLSDSKTLTKEAILKSNNIRLISSPRSNSRLFEDYRILETTIVVNNTSYKSLGDNLSKEIRKAVSMLSSGDSISITRIAALSKSTGKELTLGTRQVVGIQ